MRYLAVAACVAAFGSVSAQSFGRVAPFKPHERQALLLCRHGHVRACVKRAAIHWTVSYSRMWCIAGVETGHTYNPSVTNHYSGAAGLMQFLSSTWLGRWNRYRSHTPYEAKWAALAAGYALHLGYWSWWRDGC